MRGLDVPSEMGAGVRERDVFKDIDVLPFVVEFAVLFESVLGLDPLG